MKIRWPRAIDDRGIAHFVLPLLCVVLIAVVGTYMIVGSKAATPQTKLSTYYIYSNGGMFPHVQVSSSKNFKNARCGNNKLAKGKYVTYNTPAKKKDSYPALAIRCVTPTKAADVYYVNFYTSPPAGAPDINASTKVSHTTSLCVFIHTTDEAVSPHGAGVTRTLPRGADGKCIKSGDEEDTKERSPDKDASTSLYVPPNFSPTKRSKAGYYYLPPSPGNRDYYIHTKSMPGVESASDTPASQRYGRKNTILMFYDVAIKYNQKYPKSKLVAGDLNAPKEHASHDKGVDIDIYSSDRSAALTSGRGGSDARSIELAKILLDTRKVKFIFFNDPEVTAAVNAYADRKGLPGRMMADNATHEYHFHVRTNENPGPVMQ